MNKSKWNTFAAIINIINIVLFVISWFVIFETSLNHILIRNLITGNITTIFYVITNKAVFFYIMAWIGVIVNAISIYLSNKKNIKMTGGILGTIGNLCFGITAALAIPAVILLVISSVFLFQQCASKSKINTKK